MSHPSRVRTHRLIGGLLSTALTVAAVVTLSGCATEASTPAVPPNLATGWQDHSSPLFYSGPGLSPGTTSWKVSALMPRGAYRVIDRQGNQVRLVDGVRFEVDGSINKEILLMLPINYGNVEALEEQYVLAQAARP
jgi:hypothetical protein